MSQTIVVYPPTGSTAYEREMSTPPTLLLDYGPPLLTVVRGAYCNRPYHDAVGWSMVGLSCCS